MRRENATEHERGNTRDDDDVDVDDDDDDVGRITKRSATV